MLDPSVKCVFIVSLSVKLFVYTFMALVRWYYSMCISHLTHRFCELCIVFLFSFALNVLLPLDSLVLHRRKF